MKIKNQNIFGGNQQFADKIINSNSEHSQVDKQLIQLIHENSHSEEDRKELLLNLQKSSSNKIPAPEKVQAKSKIKIFLNGLLKTGSTEAVKQTVKAIIESGF